jgi:undecaprenyl-diphosphatase
MIPVFVVGMFFKDYVESFFGNGLLIVGSCLLITACLLTFAYYKKSGRKSEISYVDAFIIGLAQAVAVLPGLSRSGSTIATGLLLGNRKETIAQFSFLMVVVPILGEGLLEMIELIQTGTLGTELPLSSMLVGFFSAFISGCFACKFMINLVRQGKLIYFAIYCALIGAFTIVYSLL